MNHKRAFRSVVCVGVAVELLAIFVPRLSASSYTDRRVALVQRAPGAAIVLESDNAYWAQDLRYFTGITADDVVAIISGATGALTVFAPEDRIEAVRAENSGAPVLSETKIGEHLAALIETSNSETLYVEHSKLRLNSAVKDAILGLKETHPDIKVRSVSNYVGEMRAVKDEDEIRKIRIACQITCWAMEDGIATIHPGINEGALADGIRGGMLGLGAERADFWITGSGSNSTILHYMDNTRDMQDGDVVVLDWGAVFEGYLSDVTRTVPVNGKFSPRQREVYEVVLRAQEKAISMVRPGARYVDLSRSVYAILKEAGFAGKMTHTLGHNVGLDVHDVGPLTELKPGMVFTIEPGVYLPEEGFGVRIEDTVLVTEQGCEVLSRFVPKSIDAIEKLVGRARRSETTDNRQQTEDPGSESLKSEPLMVQGERIHLRYRVCTCQTALHRIRMKPRIRGFVGHRATAVHGIPLSFRAQRGIS